MLNRKSKKYLADVVDEYRAARKSHSSMKSYHEGYAVILEEVEELWAEVKKKHSNTASLRQELIQVGAMCTAFAAELLPPEE